MPRHALHRSGEMSRLVTEGQFGSELDLHEALFDYPKLIPHEAFGLGPLVVLAKEFSCAGGHIDLLLVDESGQLVICEVKKGSENTDVRKVIAQMLDYGSSLWRLPIDGFEQQVADQEPSRGDKPTGKVARALGEVTEAEAFRMRMEKCLDDGDFVFLYAVRDLDEKTARIINYLTARPRMRVFVLEVDHFTTGDDSVLVPRAASVPEWATASHETASGYDNPTADRVIDWMTAVSTSLGVRTVQAETGRRFYSKVGDAYIGVYRSARGTEFGLAGLAARDPGLAEAVRQAMRADGLEVRDDVQWPAYNCDKIVENWQALSTNTIPLFFLGGDSA